MRTTLLFVFVMSCAAAPAPAPTTVPVAPPSSGAADPVSPPKLVAGGPCVTEGKEKCVSATEGLACHEGAWERMACRAPEGCAKNHDEDVCHQTAVKENEVCNLSSDFSCRDDDLALMICTKNRWLLAQACFGERKCATEAKKLTCDNSAANLGDICREEDDYACAIPDKKRALVCRQGKFVVASLCKGPKACRVTGDKTVGFKVECDDSIADEGDSCEKEDHYSCSADGKRILACKGGHFVGDDKCRGREKCTVRSGNVGCYP